MELTAKMEKALELAKRNGAVFAGKGNGNGRGGWEYPVSAATLQALARRGLVTLGLSPDGGMMARPVAEKAGV